MADLHPKDAQRAVLGCLVQNPSVAPQVRERLGADDFVGFDGRAFGILTQMIDQGSHVDPVTFRQELQNQKALPADETALYVIRLVESPWTPSAVLHYVAIVREETRRRRLREIGLRLQQLAEEPGHDLTLAAIETSGQLDMLMLDGQKLDVLPPTIDEFLSAFEGPPDWVIPGLLEHYDRLLVTAGEGSGKSMLCRQLAASAAAGIHPFTGAQFEPKRVLLIDCENSAKQTRRRLRPLWDVVASYGLGFGDRMRVEVRPEGLDLAGGRDAAWLMRTASRVKPDLICIGPLYRLHQENPNDEGPARKVSAALDAVRTEARCALLTEAHAGHGQQGQKRDLRPFGSSLWRRWPESIRGLRPVDGRRELVAVEEAGRFDRDEREWPALLKWGEPGQWPWVEASEADVQAGNIPSPPPYEDEEF